MKINKTYLNLLENNNAHSSYFYSFTSSIKKIHLNSSYNQKIKFKDITLFLIHLLTLLSAGASIVRAFTLLENNATSSSLKKLFTELRKNILLGNSLYASLILYPTYFDPICCQLIKIGELTGKLEFIIKQIIFYREKQQTFIAKIKKSLFYPCIIISFSIVIVLGLMIFIIPKFETLYSEAQQALPFVTKSLFFVCHLLQKIFMFGFFPALLLFIIFFKPKKNYKQFFITLPFVKTIYLNISLSLFLQNFSLMLKSGILISKALDFLGKNCIHPQIKAGILSVYCKVNQGLTLFDAMEDLQFITPIMRQMIKIGEESGTIEKMLDKNIEFLDEEISSKVDFLTQSLEPLIMIILGVLIGGLVCGLYLPLFNIGNII